MVLLYALAVVCVVLAVDAVIAFGWLWVLRDKKQNVVGQVAGIPRELFVFGTVITIVLILGASLVEMWKLRKGGEGIAAMMGARAVAPDSRDLLERRLLNVVEEMAIASGVRVPKVYVMDKESGINAFASGFDVSNAIVVVTRGTLETLNRDELQGMIGHEFSHILNGDIWLNIKMLGVLAGILFVGSIGAFLVRTAGDRDSDEGKAAFFFIVIGGLLVAVGSIGVFFGRLIKASLSREREFLADASSVQFTRNPDGIAGALDRIRGASRGTLVTNRYAEEVSHMFFGPAVRHWLSGLFETHPPLDERIRRVHPRFEMSRYREQRPATDAPVAATAAVPEAAVAFAGATAAATDAAPKARAIDVAHTWDRSATQSAALVGELNAAKVDWATKLLGELPAGLRERLREPVGAAAAIVALMLAHQDQVMEEQLSAAKTAGGGELVDAARAIAPELRGLALVFELPVVDLALPALKAAPPALREQLLKALEAVVLSDRRVSLHEFVVLTLVRSQLAPRPKSAGRKSLATLRSEALLLLSVVAWAGARKGEQAQQDFDRAFQAGRREIGLEGAPPVARDNLELDAAARALDLLRELAPPSKATLMRALFAAVTADGTIRIVEAELMRTIGAAIDCPLPPLLDNIDPASLAA